MTKLKNKTVFTCQECGYQAVKWLGRCPDCNTWNSLVEEADFAPEFAKAGPSDFQAVFLKEPPISIDKIESVSNDRFSTNIAELDRVLGGGVVPGSVTLIGGDPGIGKSTLLLQVSDSVSSGRKVLYVSGEESIKQTKLRADRVGSASPQLFIVNETNLDSIQDYINKLKPQVVVIDSIQVIYKDALSSSPGSVSQVRLCAQELTFMAKKMGISLFLVGHVTKDGSIAGPRVLEHMVDTVLYFEGERHMSFRLLRAVKNRFGSTNEIGIFQMGEEGLKEVLNPSGIFLQERPKGISGFVVVPTMEGTRPLLVEVQALVSPTNFAVPRRETRGVDYNRISLISAVLERRAGLELGKFDIYVNVAGGVNITEPAVDLGIVIAIASNYKELPCDYDCVVMGEVGLGGEIRSINQIERRLKESERLGFKRALIPKNNLSGANKIDMEIIPVSFLKEALDAMFGKQDSPAPLRGEGRFSTENRR
ncbi:MAG: DNA repair protein RadA [Candidatus Omnitrophica bacterium]|nr:DNA repair protein RadA [Candidatus Omnitrophota bacterium]